MPLYHVIKTFEDNDTITRTVDRLLALRKQLKTEVSDQCGPGSFRLATWNIRDFDTNKWGQGFRLAESYLYIAEIISTFDLVAVQEIQRDMEGLEKLMRLLGHDWDYIVSDTTEGAGGNSERMAFLYNTDKVRFRKMVGEIVLPKGQKIVTHKLIKAQEDSEEPVEVSDELQFARSPYVASFQAGWFKFNLCAVHIYFGADRGDKLQRRIDEIAEIAKFFGKRQKKEHEDYILLGDFNIVSPQHQTMESLVANGFSIPPALTREESNLRGGKHYDQIALHVEEKQLEIGAAGVFRFDKSVFRSKELVGTDEEDEDFAAYFDSMPENLRDADNAGPAERRKYYRAKWRTWQMSDHYPMWVELKVDFTDHYLNSLRP